MKKVIVSFLLSFWGLAPLFVFAQDWHTDKHFSDNVLEEISGKEFTTFFNQWLYGEGYPRFTIKWHQTEHQLILNSTQQTTAPTVTPLFKVTYEIKITYTDNSTEIIPFYHDEKEKQFIYDISDNKAVKSLTFNPNNWLLATATMQLVTSIEDIQSEKSIGIYPNPTTGELQVTSYELQVTSIEVFDVYGRKQKAESRRQNVLDISHLQAGIYFVKISTEQGEIIKKIVKQ
jgi:hypothetical protein